MSVSTSQALIDVSDFILAKIGGLSTTEIVKRGRRYRYVNSTFQRIREEDKHLVVNPENLEDHAAITSAYTILSGIQDDIFESHRDLCLIILGVAGALEEHQWYEEGNSSVVHVSVSQTVFEETQKELAVAFAAGVTDSHLMQGYNLLYCSKLNFLHTDHHVGSKLDGRLMRQYVSDYFGPDALESPVVLSALKIFSHWASIQGLLYKLGLPHMNVKQDFIDRFASFPDPHSELSDYMSERLPSGTSRYSFATTCLERIGSYKYSRIIPYPEDPMYEGGWVYKLCDEIAKDPAKYHIRAKAKRLSANPVNLSELSQCWNEKHKALLSVVSLVVNAIPDMVSDYPSIHTKLPPFTDELIAKHSDYYAQLIQVANEIEEYETKDWSVDDIVLRIRNMHVFSCFDAVEKARNVIH